VILVECYPDTYLVKVMGFPRKSVAHEGGKGNVIKKLKNEKKQSIGIIDEDPYSPDPRDIANYFEKDSGAGIRLLQRGNDKRKQLVVITPYLESWLLNRAKVNGIKPETYNLPSDPEQLHRIPRIDKNRNFQEFIKQLVSQDEGIKILKKWLRGAIS